jgi:hypothetical protein
VCVCVCMGVDVVVQYTHTFTYTSTLLQTTTHIHTNTHTLALTSSASSRKCSVISVPRPRVLPRGSAMIENSASAALSHTYCSSSLCLETTVTRSATFVRFVCCGYLFIHQLNTIECITRKKIPQADHTILHNTTLNTTPPHIPRTRYTE